MSTVAVNKVIDHQEKSRFPVFQEIEQRMEAVRRRAYELFEGRGGEVGRELEDWLRAENDVFGETSVEVRETAGQFEIDVKLPGFDAKRTQVTATPTEIAIHASQKDEHHSRDVYRRFELMKPVRTDQVNAKLEHGVLHIIAPCVEQSKSITSRPVTAAVA